MQSVKNIATREDAIAATYDFRCASIETARNEEPKKPIEPRSLAWVQDLEKQIPEIESAPTRLDAFQKFADIEHHFEPLDTALDEFIAVIEGEIELQVEIARGK